MPIPHRCSSDGSESLFWYTGRQTGGEYLTNEGIKALRKEIRQESNALHEDRSKWVVWVTAATGLIGAITGLVALTGFV